MNTTDPYIIKSYTKVITEYGYNPEYGNDRVCQCGHSYYRHFDTYENMYACGCKYCSCSEFIEDNGVLKEYKFYKKNLKTREVEKNPFFICNVSNPEKAQDELLKKKLNDIKNLKNSDYFYIVTENGVEIY